MEAHFMFTKPIFTAGVVAKVIGQRLGRTLHYTEANEEVDGCVDVTDRVHVQVGADYLAVCVWETPTVLRGWPTRRNIPWVIRDLQEALRDYPEGGV